MSCCGRPSCRSVGMGRPIARAARRHWRCCDTASRLARCVCWQEDQRRSCRANESRRRLDVSRIDWTSTSPVTGPPSKEGFAPCRFRPIYSMDVRHLNACHRVRELHGRRRTMQLLTSRDRTRWPCQSDRRTLEHGTGPRMAGGSVPGELRRPAHLIVPSTPTVQFAHAPPATPRVPTPPRNALATCSALPREGHL
ncbi:hypothetical protein BU26DRAFT_151749 [Trematosphaeria pertusa]|uniref:Uncharacterized protein n=1 Tax=Trematosphaeria pertusa TaxID=390896 RepID=A0A6A6IYQ2_9PLEO|nr:uncharacterized protein BU26DRAFT_151749 [Trematosphaeria pertusa]KAF2255177.1 hypothetical protein BU26DRAFT_151749 [Trematosphaeria pertusa]